VAGVCEFLAIDCKSKHDSESSSGLREKEFDKTLEAEELVFNKKGMEKYND
jgi:hypothetical protein